MRICGREYKLSFSRSLDGAQFWTNGEADRGNGEIRISSDYKDLQMICELLIHEAFEAILLEDGKRYRPPVPSDDHSRYLFVFDHDYLNGLAPKILDALTSSGFFRVADGRKKLK